MKEQMFWLQTLLLSALNHQKNLQSHIQWELKRLLVTWNGLSVCLVISYDENSNTIKAHLLQAIKTRAKDDTGKTYWIYSEEENVDTFEEKHVLAMRPSINLAKNIKRRDPVFALMNREVIEGMTSQFYN